MSVRTQGSLTVSSDAKFEVITAVEDSVPGLTFCDAV
jgi:hypothetical protein